LEVAVAIGPPTAGDVGYVFVVSSGDYLMSTGTAFLNLQLVVTPRPAKTSVSLTIQTEEYEGPDGTVYPAYNAATYVTTGTEFGNPPVGGIYAISLTVNPAGQDSFTSPLGTIIVNDIMRP
jgi:hypothetical protein